MKDDKNYLSRFMTAMKTNKKFERSVYIIIGACVLLLCLFTGRSDDKKAETPDVQIISPTEKDTEERLSQMLSQIRGAGKVKVMITYDTTSEIVPAMTSSKQSSETDTEGGKSKNENKADQPATINNGGEQEPIVLTEIQPKVRGVIVIAEGAADISVKVKLEYATATVLGIDSSSIEVFEMQGEGN